MKGTIHKRLIRHKEGQSKGFIRNLALVALLLPALLCGCGSGLEGTIVAVEIPAGQSEPEMGARLIAWDPESPDKDPHLLTEDFAAAASPAPSHDGRYLYFQGKIKSGDPWQIWVMDLKKRSVSQVIHVPQNCTDPVSLPDETVIFSRESEVAGIPVKDLWRCGRDGCCLTRITYTPARNDESHILPEGRILFVSSQQYPDSSDPVLMVMRPDGTKSELYSEGWGDWKPVSGGNASDDGYVYFISTGGRLSRVLHRRPLHTYENLSEGFQGIFDAVMPRPDGRCLVAYKPVHEEFFGIYLLDPESSEAPELLFRGEGNLTDPVKIRAMEVRPRKLPSAVNPENPTGLLMSQNVNHSMIPVDAGVSGETKAEVILVSYLKGGETRINVEEDGSFYLKLDADKAFRIKTLNSQGELLRGPSDWLYLRPNERRACTGCHADPELAPENIQPMAVQKDPVEFYSTRKESGKEEEEIR